MSTPVTPLREAAESLAVAAHQLHLATRRAIVGGHPLHPALERLAVSVLGVATKAVLEVAAFIAEEHVRSEREGSWP
jgi:hypothetical protein